MPRRFLARHHLAPPALLLLVLLGGPLAADGQSRAPRDAVRTGESRSAHSVPVVLPAPQDALLAVARWRHEADFRADKAALDTLLADELTYGRTSGLLHTKRQVMDLVGAGGPYALDYSTPDSLAARIYGETGVVTGLLKVKLSAQPAPYTLRYTETWVRRSGRWQLVAFQGTRLP